MAHTKSTRAAVALALVGLVAAAFVGPDPAAAEVGPSPVRAEITVVPSADGSGLVLEGTEQLFTTIHGEVVWDLTALDREALRSDLVRVEVAALEGSGRLTIETEARHGRRAVVVDAPSDEPDPVMVLQVGRRTVQGWSVDREGAHVVGLRAVVPLADGGRSEGSARYRLGAGDLAPGADVPLATARGPALDGSARLVAAASAPVVIADGHVDIGPRIVEGGWRVQVKDDTTAPHVWRDLESVVLHAGDAARTEIPDRESLSFLGPPGTPYHVLPQAQRSGIVWPGWNSQDPSVVEAVPGAVTWRLREVDGPGRFVLYVTDSFGDASVLFDSQAALPQDLEIPRNSHVHGNWAFGEPGVYRLAVEMRGTTAGGEVLSDVRSLTVVVGDGTDPATVVPDPGPGPGPGAGAGGQAPGSIAVTSDLDDGAASGGGGAAGGGRLALTGFAGMAIVATGVALVALWLVLRLTSARRAVRNENHS